MIDKIDISVFERKKQKLLDNIGYIVEGEAIRRCLVVTGNMRSKITHFVEENSVKIGTVGVSYAKFVEEGTAPMIAAHGIHDPENPVTDWAALRERGGVGQTMPFLKSAAFVSKFKIEEAFRKAFP